MITTRFKFHVTVNNLLAIKRFVKVLENMGKRQAYKKVKTFNKN